MDKTCSNAVNVGVGLPSPKCMASLTTMLWVVAKFLIKSAMSGTPNSTRIWKAQTINFYVQNSQVSFNMNSFFEILSTNQIQNVDTKVCAAQNDFYFDFKAFYNECYPVLNEMLTEYRTENVSSCNSLMST